MPHRPNPIPRYNGSNVQIPELTSSRQKENNNGHRASSWAETPGTSTNSSAATTSTSSVNPANASANTGSGGGGRPSGRALPPPRFQRKQRPPRVQQALAASSSTGQSRRNAPSTGTSTTTAAVAAAAAHGRAGTLTSGPANNWGAGTSAVVSLSMATINAASARASVVHPPHPRQDYELHSETPLDIDGLDAVQLHNRITFGMGRSSTAIRNDLYTSDHIQSTSPYHHHLHHSGLTPEIDNYASARERRDPAATVRARSQSHHAATRPTSSSSSSASLYHPPIDPTRPTAATAGAYSPIHPSSPYATSSFGLDTPPMLHAAAAPPLHPHLEFDPQLRMRSQSLMAPPQIDAYRSSSSQVPPLPLSRPTFSPAVAAHAVKPTTIPPGMPMMPSSVAMQSEGDELPSTSPHSSTMMKKPLKSALKVRRSSPELGYASPFTLQQQQQHHDAPPVPTLPLSAPLPLDDVHRPSTATTAGAAGTSSRTGGRTDPYAFPDPEFTLPDALQAQYAHQLRLLQEEYANKAAKAEKSRQRSLERSKAGSTKRGSDPVVPDVPPVGAAVAGPDVGADADADAGADAGQELVVPRARTVNLDTPPSSGGGSGQRVAFFEEVQVIGKQKQQQHADRTDGGYLSWDEEWNGDEDLDEDAFVYRPNNVSTKSVAAAGGRDVDTDDSPPTDASASDFDGGSDVGDRGHDDAPRRRADSLLSPTTTTGTLDVFSPVEHIPVVSPARAVVHDHEPSPTTISEVPREAATAAHSRNVPGESGSLLPLVEVIAPTPIIASKELEPPEDAPPRFDEMDKEDGIPGAGVGGTGGTGSTESSDSNSTLKTGVVDLENVEAGGATPRLEEDPVALEPSNLDQQVDQEPAALPQLPRTLQRLAYRISRGGAVPVTSSRPPPPPLTTLPLGEYQPSSTSLSSDYLVDDDESLRRLPSITSLSSLSSGIHGATFPRPPPSFSPTVSVEQDTSSGRLSARSHTDPTPQSLYNPVPSRQATVPSIPFPATQNLRQVPPDSAMPQSQSRRMSRLSGLGEYSSTASVESGSSHGGGTSGASHMQRARGRSVAGSTLSTSSSGSHYRNPPRPSAPTQPPPAFGSNILPASGILQTSSNASPGMDSLLSHTSSSEQQHQWDKGLLSGARSTDSLGALSATSGRSGGSGASSGKGAAGRALGGESIWTLGKEEEAAWPAAPPSSSGHSGTSKDMKQYTLRSLLPQMEPAPEVTVPKVSSREQMHPVLPEPDYSYERTLPSNVVDSYYPNPNAYPTSHGPERGRIHQPITQSRSVPVLLESERVARARGEYQQQQTLPPQLRAQASFVPEVQYRQDQRLPPQAHVHVQPHPHSQVPLRSQSMHGFSDPNMRGGPDSRRNFEDNGRMEAGGYSASSSRPSTARSALYVGPGAEDADQYNRKSMMALPASGGVFPRYQEVAGPYADVSVRPGSSGGRFKSLFKSRDSRVFK